MPLAYWTHDLSPFLIHFSGNFGIRWYGLAYLTGFLGAGWLLRKYYRAGRSTVDPTAIFDLMTGLVAGVIVGGRLGYFLQRQKQMSSKKRSVLTANGNPTPKPRRPSTGSSQTNADLDHAETCAQRLSQKLQELKQQKVLRRSLEPNTNEFEILEFYGDALLYQRFFLLVSLANRAESLSF